MMTPKERFVIASRVDAASFRSRARRSLLFPKSGVDVVLACLSREEQSYWSERLTTRSRACGCRLGAAFTLAAIAASATNLLPRPDGLQGAALACLGWVFGAALAGKVLGLLGARLLLVHEAGKLILRVSSTTQGERE